MNGLIDDKLTFPTKVASDSEMKWRWNKMTYVASWITDRPRASEIALFFAEPRLSTSSAPWEDFMKPLKTRSGDFLTKRFPTRSSYFLNCRKCCTESLWNDVAILSGHARTDGLKLTKIFKFKFYPFTLAGETHLGVGLGDILDGNEEENDSSRLVFNWH